MSQYHTNKKLTKPVVPLTTDTQTVIAKRLMRRVLLEHKRGTFVDHSEYFDAVKKHISNFIGSHRAFIKFLDFNVGSENKLDFAVDTLKCIKDNERLDSDNYTFSRKFMNKQYGINKGITISVGDRWVINNVPHDTLKYEILGVGKDANEIVVLVRIFKGFNEKSLYASLPLWYVANCCNIFTFNVPEFMSLHNENYDCFGEESDYE